MYKPNQIFHYEKVSRRKILLSQLKSPLIYILLIAGVLTIAIHEYFDTAIIFLTLTINTLLGYFQEYRAQNTLYHLKALLKPIAIAIRNGKRVEIDAEEIELDDIALISKELSIPADGVLIEGKDIFVNESLLTGEVVPVKKEIGDKLYVGTIIISGVGKIRIENIGLQTKIGEIGKHILSQKEKITPLQKQINYLAKKITQLIVLITIFVFLVGLYNKYPLLQLIETVIAIAVASIPEGLVITMTVILTVGMQKILKQNAIVRRLVAAETLGSVDIICVDKTGTITEGKLKIIMTDFVNNDLALASSYLCNNQIDPLEISMMEWYEQNHHRFGSEYNKAIQSSTRLDSIPFANEHKFTATLNNINGESYMFIFGAPESVINRCNFADAEKQNLINTIKEEGEKSRKLIGLAYKKVSSLTQIKLTDVVEMNWNGFIAFEDPIRANITETILSIQKAGIQVKMITGDYIHTAISVAKIVGLLGEGHYDDLRKYIISGEEIEKLSEVEFKQKVEQCRLFVRINPNQKLAIVEMLKANGHVVAMTGDGINDAPALKKADVGIVVNEASDISKNTADMVLLNSDLKTISYSIEIGRVIFDNIRKVIIYLISGSFSEIALLLTAFALSLPSPLTPLQILWINLVEDTFPALALAYERSEKNVMQLKPRRQHEKILNRKYLILVISFILISNITLLIYYSLLRNWISDAKTIQTITFVAFGIESLMFAFSIKHLQSSIINTRVFNNWRLNVSFIIGLLLYVMVLNVPILKTAFNVADVKLEYLFIAFALGIVNVLIIEIIKYFMNRKPN
jgi:Ca2+-transporting ATPase